MEPAVLLAFIVPGAPRQKKNSARIVPMGAKCGRCGKRRFTRVLPSKPWEKWAKAAIPQLQVLSLPVIERPVNCAAIFYCDTKRKVDACNLYEGLADILEAAGVVKDDALIVSWDGSRLDLDRQDPRVEVELRAVAGTEA